MCVFVGLRIVQIKESRVQRSKWQSSPCLDTRSLLCKELPYFKHQNPLDKIGFVSPASYGQLDELVTFRFISG